MNKLFPRDLPREFASRWDGILDGLPPEVLAGLNTDPSLDDLIEELAHDLDSWLEHAMSGDHEDQRFGAERVIANLRIIAILSSLKSNAAP
jgi:hypothetical protein